MNKIRQPSYINVRKNKPVAKKPNNLSQQQFEAQQTLKGRNKMANKI